MIATRTAINARWFSIPWTVAVTASIIWIYIYINFFITPIWVFLPFATLLTLASIPFKMRIMLTGHQTNNSQHDHRDHKNGNQLLVHRFLSLISKRNKNQNYVYFIDFQNLKTLYNKIRCQTFSLNI